jgi:hypothetical protein
MRRASLLFLAMLAAAPAAHAVQPNLLVGYGIIGPAQYDQGQVRVMTTLNLTGFINAGEAWSFGGLGLALRACWGVHEHFDEFGLAVPFATYRSGRGVVQAGVEIQRYDLRKNFYYLSFGIALKGRPARKETSASRSRLAPQAPSAVVWRAARSGPDPGSSLGPARRRD